MLSLAQLTTPAAAVGAAWCMPLYARLNHCMFLTFLFAGAPPDMFDPNGQNWGFPTYNWEVMAQDGYTW
jgi:4-alpha-glucanotransferase